MKTKLFILPFVLWAMRVLALDSHAVSPRYLVHLLDYIATDYAGAVSSGKITNPTEYQEQREFVEAAIETEKQLKETRDVPEVAAGLQKLQSLVMSKAPLEDVKKIARQIEGRVIQLGGIDPAPSQWPDRRQGRELFSRNCESCHGVNGFGDGPAGKQLHPPPANLHDAKMAGNAPFQIFNAVRLGVPGTAMPGFEQLSDGEIWNIAFYVQSLRYENMSDQALAALSLPPISLKQTATLSDEDLDLLLKGSDSERRAALAALRLYIPPSDVSSLVVARLKLQTSLKAYKDGKPAEAKSDAIQAYLEGVEPVEPGLRAKDAGFTASVEEKMADVRAAIESRKGIPVVEEKVADAEAMLSRAEILLEEKTSSAWLTFTVAAGIFLREGFEAALILITLLGVIRSIGSTRAALYVHAGWILALLVGVACWFFSGWILAISGAGRELLEGTISLAAVGVLLYFGFWMHRKTEIGKWTAFIDEMVKTTLQGTKLVGLGVIAFMAVFRESLEVVLFLRALSLESGGQYQTAMLAGVLVALVVVLGLAGAIVKFSARIPLRQLFGISSLIMLVLSFILIGKAFHSFQEVGLVTVTRLPFLLRSDLVGLYPTYETLIPQLIVLVVSVVVWKMGKKGVSLPFS